MYKEVGDTAIIAGQRKARKSHYIVCELPVKVVRQKVPLDKPNVRLGVGELPQLVTCILCCRAQSMEVLLIGGYVHGRSESTMLVGALFLL